MTQPFSADGRLREGDPLQISARQWNRMCDAADAVFGAAAKIPSARPGRSADNIIPAIVDAANVDGPLPIKVGEAVGLPDLARWIDSAFPNASPVASEDDLTAYQNGVGGNTITLHTTSSCLDGQFGIVRQATYSDTDSQYTLMVQLSGIVTVRVLALGFASRVSGPVPYPNDASLQDVWRRYPVATVNGMSRVLRWGNYIKLTENEWPRVYEALIFLG